MSACLTAKPSTAGLTSASRAGEYYVSNGVIVCPQISQGNLVTDKEYSDFVLRLEYKYETNGNNGVTIRAPLTMENLTYVGVEIQMLDNIAPMHRNLKPWQYNGSVYGLVAAKNGTGRMNEWNTEEITCIGRHYHIVLNGRVIVDTDLNDVHDPEMLKTHPGFLRDRGHLGFLGHSSYFEFRNICIKELPVVQNASYKHAAEGIHRAVQRQGFERMERPGGRPADARQDDAGKTGRRASQGRSTHAQVPLEGWKMAGLFMTARAGTISARKKTTAEF